MATADSDSLRFSMLFIQLTTFVTSGVSDVLIFTSIFSLANIALILKASSPVGIFYSDGKALYAFNC